MGEEVEKLSDLEGKISDLTRSVQDIQVRQVQGVPQNMTTARRPNSWSLVVIKNLTGLTFCAFNINWEYQNSKMLFDKIKKCYLIKLKNVIW